MFRKDRLMVPGPTPLSPAVQAAGAGQMVDERTDDFAALMVRVLDNLRTVIGTADDVLCFTSSTTGAFESAVQNLFSPGERVLITSSGAFAERWIRLARAFGLDVVELTAPWGEQVPAEAVADALTADPGITAALTVHCETSTGVVADLEAFGAAARDVLTVVDSASGLGACEMRAEEWGLDVVVGGTQKALMAPPGISFASVSEYAWDRHRAAGLPRFYFDWSTTRESLAPPTARTPWTPAIGVLVQLDLALRELATEGLEARFARHRDLGRMARAGLRGLGLRLLTPDADENAAVTAAWVPERTGAEKLVAGVAERFGVQLTAGNGHYADRIVRIGHCGNVDGLDVLVAVAAIEAWLRSEGAELHPGAGTTPVADLLANHSAHGHTAAAAAQTPGCLGEQT